MIKLALALLSIASSIAINVSDCKYVFHVEEMYKPYKFAYEIDPNKNITICYTIPKHEGDPEVRSVFDSLQSIWNYNQS